MKEPVDAAAVRIFPPAVPLLTILLGVALKRLCPSKLKLNLSCLSRYGIGGAIVGIAVLGLGLYPVILLRRSGQSENPWTTTTEIVTRGPFGFTRNPLYLQMILGCIGFAVMLRNVWILLLTPLAAWRASGPCHFARRGVLGAQVRRKLSIIQTQGPSLALVGLRQVSQS